MTKRFLRSIDKNFKRVFSFFLIVILLVVSFVVGMNCKTTEHRKQIQFVNEVYQIRINNMVSSEDAESKHLCISFDDTINVFCDLSKMKYDSIFDNELLGYLKYLHDFYGACFTLYCYYENDAGTFNLSMMTDDYMAEFSENSDWLKWGFHSYSGDIIYDLENEKRAESDYTLFINELRRIMGSEECIDRIVRLNGFRGTETAIRSFTECNLGIVGLLGPDDDRLAYCLSEENSVLLKQKGYIELGEIELFRTDIRIEDSVGKKELLDESDSMIVVFSHEWKLNDNNIRTTLENICFEAIQKGYVFHFVDCEY